MVVDKLVAPVRIAGEMAEGSGLRECRSGLAAASGHPAVVCRCGLLQDAHQGCCTILSLQSTER